MGNLHIRAATADDVPAIAAIYHHAVVHGTASYELDPPGLEEMVRRFSQHVANGFPWIVAEENGKLLGYAYAGPFRPRRAYRFTVEDSIYVDPDTHGRGIGAKLLAALIAEVEAMGFRQMVAVIGDGSRHEASVRLHEKSGFVHAGKITGTGYKHGRWLDTVFMQLSLNGGDGSPPDPQSFPEKEFQRQQDKPVS